MSLVLQSSGGGQITIQEPATASNFTQTLPAVSGTVITTGNIPAGSVLQVVQATYSTEATTTSTSFVDTNLTASITPTSATSKILVLVNMNAQSYVTSGNARDTGGSFKVVRNSTDIWGSNTVNFYIDGGVSATLSFNILNLWSVNYLDSPATTSATTYKVQFKAISGRTMGINSSSSAASVITLMEIAA